MIYFLDNSLQLQKIVTSKNVISAIHEHELNGLIRADVELDLSYANKFLVLGIDHVGYYYKDEFYLHKIQRVEYDHVNETATVVLRHIFFEDMIFGKLIQDVRPQNQDALTVSRQTIDANTRWQTIMTDVTGRLSTNFYWQVPYEVIEFMTENYRIEYLPKILFDGKKINGFQLHLANKIGEDKNIRIPYGSRVLDLKYEEDYSEIITKLVVHGKGEEVGDGYGRRINISDVNFSRNGVKSPVGSLYLEDESITNTYGNDGQTPREGREVFEDIEDANELAEAGYQHYLQVSRPQMLFTADVADIGDVGIGDSVMIIRREYDVYFNARIHKLSVDLLYPEDAQVELGDYEHFKESKIARKTREKNNRVQGQLSDRITRLKIAADERFDNEVGQWKSEYEQALIDVRAEIAADRENMTNLIEGTRSEFTDNLNAEITQTKEYAEQQAQEKAETVRTDLETVTNGHQQMLDVLESNVINIDDFLGDSRSITLDERFQNIRLDFEERIRNIDSTHYNMIRGTSFDNPDLMDNHGSVQIITDETDNFARLGAGTTTVPYILPKEYFHVEQGVTYHLVFTYRTSDVPEIDYARLRPPSGYGVDLRIEDQVSSSDLQTAMTGQWSKKVYTFVSDRSMPVRLLLGTNFSAGDTQRGILDIKKPYLTTTNNREWLPHPDDDVQNVSEIVRRVTLLEDGRSELITRTEFDFETESIIQDVKRVESTVEGSQTVLQRLEDWEATNGAAISETVYGFEQKVWLNDVSEINPNLLSFGDFSYSDIRKYWKAHGSNATAITSDGFYRVRHTNSGSTISAETPPFKVEEGKNYTLSFKGSKSNIDGASFDRVYNLNDIGQASTIVGAYLQSHGRHTYKFTAHRTGELRAVIGTTTPVGKDVSIYIGFIKVEEGWDETPFLNSISLLEHSASEIRLAVQELNGNTIKESDLQITADYWQLGSTRIGAEDVSSVLRGSPDALDAVVSNFNLTGNLNANGQITSLAVDAIEGNFARLFANQLTANVITSDHIQVGTALIDKFFATAARIDQLITKTHFVNEMHALTLNVVELNASQIRTRLLSANTIEASWIKSGTALLDRVFSSTAMFERMMAKSGFVTTLNTVTIDTDQLTIRRPDGVAWVSNGMARFDIPVQVQEFRDTSVEWTGQRYVTNSRGTQKCAILYTSHAGRYLRIGLTTGMRYDAQHASTRMGVVIRPENSPSGTNWQPMIQEMTVYKSGNNYQIYEIDLGRPTFAAASFSLEFYRIGDNVENPVTLRIHRAWITG